MVNGMLRLGTFPSFSEPARSTSESFPQKCSSVVRSCALTVKHNTCTLYLKSSNTRRHEGLQRTM